MKNGLIAEKQNRSRRSMYGYENQSITDQLILGQERNRSRKCEPVLTAHNVNMGDL